MARIKATTDTMVPSIGEIRRGRKLKEVVPSTRVEHFEKEYLYRHASCRRVKIDITGFEPDQLKMPRRNNSLSLN
jgi:hypothetical protein